ncbi:phosphatidate cytidylyltransferase [Georgenia faecalis]|uniref:Phosphatidate cytidylyltransferase n=1 Tax=Georgenia faecalis TaxID=2483799 RepID=A0ABV9DBC1_9MICO|nr:phosphatidate cytidylyltransferase [Georgenia faecalis]
MTAPDDGVPTRRRMREAQAAARRALVEPAPPRPVDPPASRAGRNLPAAIGVGLGLGAVLLASLFIRREAFVVLALLAACGALWELARAVRTRDIRIPVLPLWVGTAGVLVSAYTAGPEAMFIAFVLTAGGVFVWRVLDGGGPDAVRDASAGIFAAAYISLLAGFAVLLVAQDQGPWLVLTFIALVVANDTGGYIAGVLFGKHPLAPSISPKKSWEGLAGSLVLACAVGSVMVLRVGAPWWAGAVLGAGIVVSGTVGDLAESLLKRDLGMKDMGTLLPGHGGVMDRLDSLVVSAPVCYLLMSLLVG